MEDALSLQTFSFIPANIADITVCSISQQTTWQYPPPLSRLSAECLSLWGRPYYLSLCHCVRQSGSALLLNNLSRVSGSDCCLCWRRQQRLFRVFGMLRRGILWCCVLRLSSCGNVNQSRHKFRKKDGTTAELNLKIIIL